MQAALWDLVWERGGAWSTRIARRAPSTTAEDVAITLGEPCRLEVRGIDDPSTTAAALAVVATVALDGSHADFVVTRAQIEALSARRYQHRIIVTDRSTGLPVVLLRGYVSIRDRVGDQ